ncbi:glycosyl transferase family 1 [Arthrobacter livingstonensis]|uniref:D-inositol 3-phosphate glycosyltransferase n=1 Tax=Arthrobacter livingstonensis TaxID=670078 RepID=A0A2V5LY64_9MICC|nr:glycosyltransferase [Arthrobacter livingstonensis]PYI68807.1 glycosyl transferase family 1 [Arthrobacter livingstonensis]
MKYDDEVARTSAIQLAKRRQYAQDIDSLIEECEVAVSLVQCRDGELASIRKELAATRQARDRFKSASESSAAEVHRLKKTLSKLRSSRTYLLGKAVGRPIRLVAASGRSVIGLARTQLARPTGNAVGDLPQSTNGMKTVADHGLSHARNVDLMAEPKEGSPNEKYFQLLAEFTSHPSKGTAIKVINQDFFSCGSLLRAMEFVEKNSSILEDLSPKEQQIIENIRGQAQLLKAAPFIPPRQSNVGYLAERGRVMYCAHSTGAYNSNGYSTRTAGITFGLESLGTDVVVVARPGYPWDSKVELPPRENKRYEQTINGVLHVFNPGPSWTADRLDYYLAEAVDVFVREAQRNRVALIHSASNHVTALPALIAARRLGIPFVYEVRGLWEITDASTKRNWEGSDRFSLALRLESLVASAADAVLAITEQVRQELIVRGVGSDKITLLPNAVDTDVFTPMPESPTLRGKLGISDTATILGYAGSLVAYEGISDTISSVKILHEKGMDVAFVVVGDGRDLARLKEQASEAGVSDFVVFTGRVSSTEIPKYISLFDIMPCPRLRLPVTEMVSPLKPLEAMACGKAVILSDLPPMRDLGGSDGERAVFAAPGDIESLVCAISKLIGDPGLRQTIARRARLWTVQQRTWLQAGTKVLAAHREAVDSYKAIQEGRELHDLTIGIISDRFTFEGLRFEARLVALKPETWQAQIEAEPIDVLFVESAWEGLDGDWNHKVGFYDADSFEDLRDIIKFCNEFGVPSIFWNKEDPVHFNRFRYTSKFFEHIFTTDATCITAYMENAGTRQKTVTSLPFYAQPKLHNILPGSRPYEHNVNYAGSYYGERFSDRSAELSKLLGAASNQGLSIYDRQHLNPESPYKFPDELARFVVGGLDYREMVDAYKAHPVHINVNSVLDSPTMFSRRVMEIIASGGAVVSGKGRGVDEVFNGLVPVVSSKSEASLLMNEWLNNEATRLRDVWLGYRLVHRAHTAGYRLAYALRTAGLRVRAPEPAVYSVFCDQLTDKVASDLLRQTVRPNRIYTLGAATSATCDIPIEIVSSLAEARDEARAAGTEWMGVLEGSATDRTLFEDMLTATTFGDWEKIGCTDMDMDARGGGLSRLGLLATGSTCLESTTAGNRESLVLRRPRVSLTPADVVSPFVEPKNCKVLVAGHDLKFAGALIRDLESQGHTVSIDQWQGHSQHDEASSLCLLDDADVIFCEWTLGNAVWYSRNKLPHQRLVTRLHLQELSTPYVKKVNFDNVDSIIFVGQHMKDMANRDFSVPSSKSVVIPNMVDTLGLAQAKTLDAQFNIGFVGIIPERKRLDIALDVIARLRAIDSRFMLFVKGKLPSDYAWMADRPEEMDYYDAQFSRLESDPLLSNAVHFDGYDSDMHGWYKKIGHVLSTSDFESFHLTLADGAASGAVPVSLAWSGADQIYPTDWLVADADEIVTSILAANSSLTETDRRRQEAKVYATDHFSHAKVLGAIRETLFNGMLGHGQ